MSLSSIAQHLPFTYTGADFYALCSDAMLKAVTRQATAVDNKIKALNSNLPPGKPPISTSNFFDHHAKPDDIAVMVTEEDFLGANRELVPSVSAGELQHYERVRATFEGVRDKKGPAGRPNLPGAVLGSSDTSIDQPKLSGKGKARAVSGKGKGKATAADSEEDSDGDGGVTPGSYQNTGANGKGKGKGKAVMSFEQGTGSDDDELY